ncbi:recombinase, partial [Acinetobacter baumannii]|nr:recombinase [Acinetobacter baumannii]
MNKNTVSILFIKPVLLKDMRSSMTDKTKLIALSRPDDMSALDALKLLR